MKKFLLAMSIVLALFVTTSCGVKAPEGEVVITLKNNALFSYENITLCDAETLEPTDDNVVSSLKWGKKATFFAPQNAEVFFKMELGGEKFSTKKFTADEDKEVKLLDVLL